MSGTESVALVIEHGILTSRPWVLIDYDVRCMESIPEVRKKGLVANEHAVTREDMQTLKNDWLTDNVGLNGENNPSSWDI